MDKQYRYTTNLILPGKGGKRIDSEFYVEGYAATFERYLLYEYKYKDETMRLYEEISPDAFVGADMSDIIMQYDHRGRVLARTRNKTLGIEIDAKGLFMYADLSHSNAANELYNDISCGLVDRMSWAFSIDEQDIEEIDEQTRVYKIQRIKKIYDVSAVSTPANDNTEISARRFFESIGRNATELRKRVLNLKINIK